MKQLFFYFLVIISITACIEETDTQIEQPAIELLSPLPCDTLIFGEAFCYKVKITDNTGMGNISMDMHNNFGLHSHGVHETCNMDDPKEAINPASGNWIFTLPEEKTEFVFDTLITMPLNKNDTTLFDTGDYHFHIYVTDNEGYQTFTTIDVKIIY